MRKIVYFPIPKSSKKHQIRFAMTGGYAYRLGKVYESGSPNFDQFSENFRQGFHLNGELQYLFYQDFGIGFIVNHIRQSASVENIRIPYSFSPINSYKESQGITFLVPHAHRSVQ